MVPDVALGSGVFYTLFAPAFIQIPPPGPGPCGRQGSGSAGHCSFPLLEESGPTGSRGPAGRAPPLSRPDPGLLPVHFKPSNRPNRRFALNCRKRNRRTLPSGGSDCRKTFPTGKPRRVLPPEGGKIKSTSVIFEDMCLGNDTARPASVPKGCARQAVSPLLKKTLGLFQQAEPPDAAVRRFHTIRLIRGDRR